jgi:hypothetical protein
MTHTIWTEEEEKIAHQAFEAAYEREINTLIEHVRQTTTNLSKLDEVWHLHDYLSAKRHEIDGKYDYRYPVLLFVFAQLLQEGWLHLHELQGLDPDKLAKLKALSQM